jgi:hypothetical protein
MENLIVKYPGGRVKIYLFCRAVKIKMPCVEKCLFSD